MQTKLDERDDLMAMIDRLSLHDRQKLNIFLVGIEAGKELSRTTQSCEKKYESSDAKSE